MQQSICSFLRRHFYALLLVVFLVSSPVYAAPDRYVLITLLHTNDMHGTVMPEDGRTGLAKIATLVRSIRSEMPNVVLLDAGDIIHGTFEEYLSRGKAIIASMNAAGYEIATVGNHEFDWGSSTAKEAMQTAVFPFVSANIKDKSTGSNWNGMPSYVIKTVDGVRIAVFGLGTPQTLDFEWPSKVADVRFIDPIVTAKALLPELKKQADVIIALSHLGFAQDQLLAKEVPGIDFIIGGHSHTRLDRWTWVGNTMISHAGAMATYLGRIDFIARVGDTGASIVSVNGKDGKTWSQLARKPLDKNYPESPLIPVTADIADDPLVVQAYMPFRQKVREILDEAIGQTNQGVANTVTDEESPAANLVADAIRYAMASDIAVVDPASVQGSLAPGIITVESAFRMIGGYTRQHLVKVEVTGSTLVDLLNNYMTKKKWPILAVSGINVTYKLDDQGRAKVQQVTRLGFPLDPAKVYTLASQAYVIMDWMKAHPEIRVIADPDTTTREAITGFIKANYKMEYKPEGRVVKVQ